MQATTTEQKRTAQTYTNAVGALAEVGFSSVERLTQLNQNLARAALQDCLSASNELLAVRDVNALQNLQTSTTTPALAQLTDYLRSVQEIAFDLGYSSGSAFIAMFARQAGCTPEQYRRSHLEGGKV